jgi:hypothetical protein
LVEAKRPQRMIGPFTEAEAEEIYQDAFETPDDD